MGAGALAGCSPSVVDYCAPGTPECANMNADASVGDAEAGGGCDPSQTPHDSPCALDEAYGVFVSPAGADTNPGTRAAPLRTIGHGMDVAKAAGKRVYVCEGSFDEPLTVSAARDGIGVYGALDCTTWSYGAAHRVVVAPSRPGFVLALTGLQTGATFEDVEFDAQGAPPGSAGASSVAVFAFSSRNVDFHRVTMVAGSATDGSPGVSPAGASVDGGAAASNWAGTPPDYAELNGLAGSDAGGAPARTCTCADQSSSTGGAGGGPLNVPTPTAGSPSYGDGGAGAGGLNAAVCGNGGSPSANGGDAPPNAADAPSTSLGTCSANGWTPGSSVAGSDGRPGQGGGGGGNGRLSNGSGGGGACGGCGGAGGKPGLGGGSSMALLACESNVTLTACVLTAQAAGRGGAGGNGEAGQAGGSPGSPSGAGVGVGCPGGAGGAGAGGNGGQGGPGGLSVGIGYAGAPPTLDGVAVPQAASHPGITVGGAGAGGPGGSKGAAAAISTGSAGVDGPAGPSGTAAAVEALP
jgi:hypothetical protein